MDSDGDGRHNGIELGDPWCQWTPDNKYSLQLATSHPGNAQTIELISQETTSQGTS